MWGGCEERLPIGRYAAQRLFIGCALAILLIPACRAARHEKTEGPPPTLRIATDPLEYYPLSSFYLMSRTSSSSLDFIDNEHLLFTFRVTGLLKRLPECNSGDEDQVIRALVIHLPDGRVERSAEWRMHDRGHYLWSLPEGKFLVRQRDSLMLTDASLELKPFLNSKTPIRLVKPSPDAKLLLVESDLEKHTEEEHRKLAAQALADEVSPPREDVLLTVLRVNDRSLVTQVRSLNVVDLPMISNGLLETLSARGDHWMLRYRPFEGESSMVTDVASSCRPSESPLNDKTAIVRTCPERGDDLFLQAISLDGKKLWTYRADDHYTWMTMAASQSGTRIAFSTLRVAHPVDAGDPIDETELQAQRVEVFDVNTGQLELTRYATPILSAGQNYALSPDGGRFAVLREKAIEVYDLPPAPSAERAGGGG